MEIQNFLTESLKYLSKALSGIKVLLGFVWSIITYTLFPEDAFKTALVAVCVAMVLDIVTKWYAICKNNGGYKKAVNNKKLYSKSMWEGTSVKIFSYLVISILTGLSYRVMFLEQASSFFATFVYSMLFLRDMQSCIENLMEAGADLGWLKLFVKEKQNKLMKKEQLKEKEER